MTINAVGVYAVMIYRHKQAGYDTHIVAVQVLSHVRACGILGLGTVALGVFSQSTLYSLFSLHYQLHIH
jgi:hypothetical protein